METISNSGKRRPGRPANDRSLTLSVRVTREALDKLNRLTRNKSVFSDSLIMQQPE